MKPDTAADLSERTGASVVDAWVLRDGQAAAAMQQTVIDEEPVALQVNGIAHAVMLATPADLEDFALGFLLTEGLIDSVADLLDTAVEPGCDGTVLRLQINARCEARFKERRRWLAGRTGCGLCGVESLDQLTMTVPRFDGSLRIDSSALQRAMQGLLEHQPLQHLTGAAHAAAWCHADGSVALVREDVGRHNALDKLAGALARQATLHAADGFIAVTSRASYEMVHKAARAGVGLLAAVSAPTRRAIALADEAGLTLTGFVRDTRTTVYTHPQRLL